MCGRIACILGGDDLSCATAYIKEGANSYSKPAQDKSTKDIKTSYNIPPTGVIPVIVSCTQKYFEDFRPTDRVLVSMRFGLIPPWMKSKVKYMDLETHLCKVERMRESKLYNPLFEKDYKCVIPCLGYYEWQSTKAMNKQPYFFFNKRNSPAALASCKGSFDPDQGWIGVQLLYLAGIYSVYYDAEGKRCYSFAILTRESPEDWKWVHHRMPVVLQSDQDIDVWINTRSSVDASLELLNKPITNLSAHPVDREIVNRTRNNIPKCIEPIELNKPTSKIMKAWLENAPKSKPENSVNESDDDMKSQISIKKWIESTKSNVNSKENNEKKKRTLLDEWLSSPQKKQKK